MTDDPLMVELFKKLPAPGSHWPIDERGLWLSACEAAINLLYGPADRVELPMFPLPALSTEEADRLKEAINRAPRPQIEIDRSEVLFAGDAVGDTLGGPQFQAGDTISDSSGKLDGHVVVATRDSAPPARDVQSTPRPDGIPTTFGMIRDVLEAQPGLTAREVVDAIAARWWPGLQFKFMAPDISTGITKGRLKRDDDGKLTVTEKGFASKSTDERTIKVNPAPRAAADDREDRTVLLQDRAKRPPASPTPTGDERTMMMREIIARESAPQKAPAPLAGQPQAFKPRVAAPGAKLGPPSRGANEIEFVHGDKTVNLRGTEYMVATKLRAAMGKGHISVQFLAETVLGASKRNAIDSKLVLKDLCEGMSARLRTVGLTIDYFEGYGFLMKELS